MAKINDIIREMEALLDGADLSNTPQGRQLAESYAEICEGLNSALQECRNMFDMGAYAEARRLNLRARPALTERWNILNFPRRDEWIQLCTLYNWQMPPEFDTEVINTLLDKGESDVEISIEELQNQWRRIIRDGSLYEKLILARKIYALSPNKSAYSNLVNVERPWINQLKNEADAAMEEGRDEELLEIYQELTSSELVSKVSSEDLKKYRPSIDAYKKTLLQQEKEQLLSMIASCYAAMLMEELEEALAAWAQLEKNPLFFVTRDEELQINDARNFFREQQGIINENERFESLQHELEFLLNEEHADPSEIDVVYHQLRMFDRPIKTVLEERVNDFNTRKELDNSRRHVRKCISWACSILAAAILIFIGIYLVHNELELRRDSAKIREMLDERHLEAAVEYCEKISQERPMTAKRAAIVALRTEAENLLKESQAAEKIFNEICETLTTTYLNEEKVLDPAVSELFQTLEEKSKLLPQDKSAAKDKLRAKYQTLQENAFLKNEAVFLKEVRVIQEQWANLLNRIEDFSEVEFTNQSNALQSRSDKLLNSFRNRIRETTLTEQKNNFANYSRQSDERVRQLREFRADTRQLYHPESLEIYADALEKIGGKSTRIAGIFKQAAKQFPRERAIYNIPGNYDNRFRAAGAFQVNPYFRDLKTAGNPPFYDGASSREFQKKFNNLRNEILEKEYRLYELKFKAQDKIYHLYFSNPAKDIEIEWNWEHSKIKAVNFRFTIAPNGSMAKAIFKLSVPKKQAMTLDEQLTAMKLNFVPGQSFSQLPAELQMEQPRLLTNINSISYSSHYQELKEILDAMGDKPRYMDITSAIISIVESKKITNIYAKSHLIKSLYELLPVKENTLYKQLLGPLEDLINEYSDSDEKCRWMDPTATFKNQKTAEFDQRLNKLGLREKFGLIRMNELLLESACKRIPSAIGVLYKEQNSWRLHQFKHGMNVTEVSVHYFPDGGESKKLYPFAFQVEIFSMPVANDKLPEELKKIVYNGMLVFAVPDSISYSEDVARIRKEVESAGYTLPHDPTLIRWPESWPLNSRKFN